jgi:hypothetical protein
MRVAADAHGVFRVPSSEAKIIYVHGLVGQPQSPAQKHKRHFEAGDVLLVRAKNRGGLPEPAPKTTIASYERILIAILKE